MIEARHRWTRTDFLQYQGGDPLDYRIETSMLIITPCFNDFIH